MKWGSPFLLVGSWVTRNSTRGTADVVQPYLGRLKAYKYHRLQIKSNRIVGTRPLVYRRDYVTLSPVLYHTNPQDHCPAECSA